MSAYVIKVTMENTHPPMWRRIVIPDKISFLDLHKILQEVFGWSDSHLHDFSFPNSNERVSLEPGEISEKTTAVDSYLQDYKWIRYTYDFGDDWRHKIVLEKIDETYQERYAKVIKYKGDNFNEDSGGIWSMYEEYDEEDEDDAFSMRLDRQDYSMDEVNCSLANMICKECKIKAGGKCKELTLENLGLPKGTIPKDIETQFHKMPKEMQQLFLKGLAKEFGQYMGKELLKTSQPSVWDKKVDAWYDFYEKYAEHPAHEQKNHKEVDYQQLTLFDTPQSLQQKKSKGYYIEKREGCATCLEILSKIGRTHLRDYAKYLRLEIADQDTDMDCAKRIHDFLREHLEYYFYVFNKTQLKELFALQQAPCGIYDELLESNVIIKAMLLGFIEVDIAKVQTNEVAYLYFAKDADEIIQNISKLNMEKEYKHIDQISDQIGACIKGYGILEIPKCEEACREHCSSNISSADFERMIYWHARMNGYVDTFTAKDGKAYVASSEIDAQEIIMAQIQDYADIPMRRYTPEEWKSIERGFGIAEPYWAGLEDLLRKVGDTDEDESAHFIEVWNLNIMNGCSLHDMEEEIINIYDINNINDEVDLWLILINIFMCTSLFVVKGHSRHSLHSTCGKPFDYVPMLVEDYMIASVDDIASDTSLSEMPAEIQYEIYRACSQDNIGQIEKHIRSITSKLPTWNVEIEILMVHLFIMANMLQKAENIVRGLCIKVKNTECEYLLDELEETKQTIHGMMQEYGIPFVRAEKKIGRNEPCPCGSGKKYKNCCGKNN